MSAAVERIRIRDLTDDVHSEMLALVESYYCDPRAGLEEELGYGDRVYLMRDGQGSVGSFLIVALHHDETEIVARPHAFTYLGLGCATKTPFVPLARSVKDDFAPLVPAGGVGVLHLSTRTPFAYHAIESAYGSDVFPTTSGASDHLAVDIAAYIKRAIHRHDARSPDEDPFLLSEVKKVRFTDQELARIRRFEGVTPLDRYGLNERAGDELIVLHTFARP